MTTLTRTLTRAALTATAAIALVAATVPANAATPAAADPPAHTTTTTLLLKNTGKQWLQMMWVYQNGTITVDGFDGQHTPNIWLLPGKTTAITINVPDTNTNFGNNQARIIFYETPHAGPGTPRPATPPTPGSIGPQWAELDLTGNWNPTGQTELVRPGYESLSAHSFGYTQNVGTYTSNQNYVLFNGTRPLPDGALNIPADPAGTPIDINTK